MHLTFISRGLLDISPQSTASSFINFKGFLFYTNQYGVGILMKTQIFIQNEVVWLQPVQFELP